MAEEKQPTEQGSEPMMKIYALGKFMKEFKVNAQRGMAAEVGNGSVVFDGCEVPYTDTVLLMRIDEQDADAALAIMREYDLGGPEKETQTNGIAALAEKKYSELEKTEDPLYTAFDEERGDFFYDKFLELSEGWNKTIKTALEERRKRITAMHEHIEKNAMYGEF